jgi:hypothetical protein
VADGSPKRTSGLRWGPPALSLEGADPSLGPQTHCSPPPGFGIWQRPLRQLEHTPCCEDSSSPKSKPPSFCNPTPRDDTPRPPAHSIRSATNCGCASARHQFTRLFLQHADSYDGHPIDEDPDHALFPSRALAETVPPFLCPDGLSRSRPTITMPFLRRRGNMASESDMRRHSLVDPLAAPAPKQPPFNPGSTAELPALTSVAEDLTSPNNPLPSTDLPRDSISVASTHGVPSIVEPSDGPASINGSDYSHKHRRFSMLRFRNASDSQLAAKAKLHAAAEKPPPVPRRTCLSLALVVPVHPSAQVGYRGLELTLLSYSSRNHHHRPNLPPCWPPKEDVSDELWTAAPVGRALQDKRGQ